MTRFATYSCYIQSTDWLGTTLLSGMTRFATNFMNQVEDTANERTTLLSGMTRFATLADAPLQERLFGTTLLSGMTRFATRKLRDGWGAANVEQPSFRE